MRKAFLGAIATVAAIGGSVRAAVIDTYTRADASPVTDSVGATETGGYDYVERGNTPAAIPSTGIAEIVGGELKIVGKGPGANQPGGVFLSGYDSADLT